MKTTSFIKASDFIQHVSNGAKCILQLSILNLALTLRYIDIYPHVYSPVCVCLVL